MQKWEYLSLVADLDSKHYWHPKVIDGKEIENWEKGADLSQYIKQLGDEGWELISEHLDNLVHYKQWEYMKIMPDRDWKEIKTPYGTCYEGIDGYFEYINDLGKKGWELASTTVESYFGGVSDRYILIFKRLRVHKILRLRFKRPREVE
jgi:hypothetical protein